MADPGAQEKAEVLAQVFMQEALASLTPEWLAFADLPASWNAYETLVWCGVAERRLEQLSGPGGVEKGTRYWYRLCPASQSAVNRFVFERADGCSGNGYACERCGCLWVDHIAPGSQCPTVPGSRAVDELCALWIDAQKDAWKLNQGVGRRQKRLYFAVPDREFGKTWKLVCVGVLALLVCLVGVQ